MRRIHVAVGVACLSLAVAGCNRAETEQNARRVSAAEPSSEPVGTSGTQPASPINPIDDASMTTSIQAKFFRDGLLKSRHIDVATQGGRVTLRGAVANDNERAQARLLAWTTQGVQRVDDVLTIDPSVAQPAAAPAPAGGPAAPEAPAAAVSQDTALEERIRTQLESDARTAAGTISVSARDGVVLLDGTVPAQAARQRALTLARQTEGVVQVVDRLRVEPRTPRR